MKRNTKDKRSLRKGGETGIALLRLIKTLIIAVAVIIVAIMIGRIFNSDKEPDITNTFISDKLEAVSELVSAEMTYNGLVRYTDGNVPFLTQKAFSMIYRAEVKAGIDLEEVDIDVTDSKVKIILPEIELLDISIDSDSIQFYDEKSALFNWTEKEDVIDAIKAAEDDVKANADVDRLKEKAKEQTEIILECLFEDTIGDRTLEISYK